MSELDFESRLGGQLRAYAQGGVRPIDRYAIAAATVTAGSTRRPAFRLGRPGWMTTRSSRRMVLILVAAATVLALAGGALLLSAGHPPELRPPPLPSLRAPSPTTPSPAVSGSSGYEAILLRATSDALVERGYTIAAEIDIISIRTNGQERLVRHLSSSILPAGRSFRLGGSLSKDGWLSMPTFVGQPDNDFAWALIDLADPAREPQLVASVLGGAWGPGGLFATALSCCWRVMIVDAETGSTSTQINAASLPGGGPDIIWAADGSGVLVSNALDRSGQRGYGIAPILGGPTTFGVPLLANRISPRVFGADGRMLCVAFYTSCGTSDGTVRTTRATLDPTSPTTTWYAGELAPASLVQASYSTDGGSIWLLLDRKEGPSHVAVIARADAPGDARVVSAVALGADLAPTSFAMGPDDSIVVVSTNNLGGESTAGPGVLIATADGAAYAHVACMIGFVPASVADAWPGGSPFTAVPDAARSPASDRTASPSSP